MKAPLIFFGTILVCLTFNATAQSFHKDITVSIRYLGKSPPSWKVEVPPDQLNALGVLREGDRVTFSMQSPGETTLGQWVQKDRWFSHRSCRTRWFKKKCKDHYATSECVIKRVQDPSNGVLELKVHFLPDGPNTTAITNEEKQLGRGQRHVEVVLKGPRLLRLTGQFKMASLACTSLRGSPVGKIEDRNIKGKSMPESWFTLKVRVEPAELDG
jgi:hypothetical protein